MNLVRFALTAAGFVFVALGGAALFVPLLPTTPFLLLGGFCLARGSSRHHVWLCRQRWYQQFVAGYTNGQGIPLHAKVTTLVALWGALTVSLMWLGLNLWVHPPMLVVALAVTALMLRVKTQRATLEAPRGC